ncbi:hypothetical protein XaC1_86 [Xanthomonas phage XaC1]|nr:hypothetical protein XaC1_86 [Xanthomonas phage XaC1]
MKNKLIDELQEFKRVTDIFNNTLGNISTEGRLLLTYETQDESLLAVSVRDEHSSISFKWHSILTYFKLDEDCSNLDPTLLASIAVRNNSIVLDRHKLHIKENSDTFYFNDLNDDQDLFNHRIMLEENILMCIECALCVKIPEEYQVCVIDMAAFDNYIYRKLIDLTYD